MFPHYHYIEYRLLFNLKIIQNGTNVNNILTTLPVLLDIKTRSYFRGMRVIFNVRKSENKTMVLMSSGLIIEENQ